MIGESQRHGRRRLVPRIWCQTLMHTAEVVMSHEQADGRGVAFRLLREAVRQPRETPRLHAEREVAALHIGGPQSTGATGLKRGQHPRVWSTRPVPAGSRIDPLGA